MLMPLLPTNKQSASHSKLPISCIMLMILTVFTGQHATMLTSQGKLHLEHGDGEMVSAKHDP